jgi:ribonucleotide reductase alpha subunit
MTQAIFRFTNGATLVKDNMIRPQRLVDGEESQRVFMDIKQPRKSFTGMELYFWNPGSTTTVYIDDISVEQFQE